MIRVLIFTAFMMCGAVSVAAEGRWHVGIELGEIPFHGSFKPGISVGYSFNDFCYAGVVYQIRDHIQRDHSSFNAQAIQLPGLERSSEQVGQRAYVHMRLRPHRLAPFVSLGFVYNDADTETIQFDDRERLIGDRLIRGPLKIVQKRPRGFRPALGLGYGYVFDSGFEVFAEWAGWWFQKAPKPQLEISGVNDVVVLQDLENRIVRSFQSSIFNTYHIFQVGVGYTF